MQRYVSQQLSTPRRLQGTRGKSLLSKRITKLSMTWKVGASASPSRAFYSPWFGMDPDDNLNLIQPVNPWSGSAWSMCKVSPPTHPPCMRNHLKSL